MPYKESKQFLRNFKKYEEHFKQSADKQMKLLEHVLGHTLANNPQDVLDGINTFSRQNWMMNVGEQKGEILKIALKKSKPKTILELGGYCGFSALLMAFNSQAKVHSIEPDKHVADIAHRIHQHSGLSQRITIHIGTIQSEENFIKSHGIFDFIFIDHVKHLYLHDLKELERMGAIGKGTVVVGDNIIYPGAPDYLKYFQESSQYDSTLYHSYLEYTNQPDAILISEKIV